MVQTWGLPVLDIEAPCGGLVEVGRARFWHEDSSVMARTISCSQPTPSKVIFEPDGILPLSNQAIEPAIDIHCARRFEHLLSI